MTPAAHQLLRALYLHALAPSTANQDAVRAAGAALDTETARALNAPRVQRSSGNVFRDLGRPDADAKFQAAKEAARGLSVDSIVAYQEPLGREFDAPVPDQIQIAPTGDDDGQLAWQVWDEVGDLIADGVAPGLVDALAQVAEVVHAPRSPAPVDSIVAEVRADLLARSERGIAKYGVTLDRRDLGHAQWLQHGYEEALDLACYLKRAMRDVTDDALATAPVEPPHAAAPSLATLTPEPAEAVLGRAGDALAWDGRQPPVHVPFEPGAPHPYGDDAYQMTTDGVARLFPSKEAAQRWLAAMGKPPA